MIKVKGQERDASHCTHFAMEACDQLAALSSGLVS